jgi:phospholipase A1/A2
MKIQRSAAVRRGRPKPASVELFAVVFGGLLLSGIGQADDLTECMTRMMQQGSDDTTIGELRRSCQNQLHGAEPIVPIEAEPAVVSQRMRLDKDHVLEPFALMAHKPNYILMAAYNSSGYDATVYREQYDDPDLQFDDAEAQFQISIKMPLAIGLLDTFDLYAAYTNR